MRKPKLLDCVHAVAKMRHLYLGTERAYSDWIRRYIPVWGLLTTSNDLFVIRTFFTSDSYPYKCKLKQVFCPQHKDDVASGRRP
jgi:hypothetical protein